MSKSHDYGNKIEKQEDEKTKKIKIKGKKLLPNFGK